MLFITESIRSAVTVSGYDISSRHCSTFFRHTVAIPFPVRDLSRVGRFRLPSAATFRTFSLEVSGRFPKKKKKLRDGQVKRTVGGRLPRTVYFCFHPTFAPESRTQLGRQLSKLEITSFRVRRF